LPFTISWKASRNDARGKPSGRLFPGQPSRQGLVGRQARPFPSLGKRERRPLPPLRGGKLTSEDISLAGRKTRTREGSGPVPKDKTSRHMASRYHGEISCHPPENAHGGRAAEVHYDGLTEGIITTTGAVMTDKIGWSSPIGAAR
jgi:hypothetical protein